MIFFQVAALDDSPEYYLAVRRNAQVNKGETLEDINTTAIKLKSYHNRRGIEDNFFNMVQKLINNS